MSGPPIEPGGREPDPYRPTSRRQRLAILLVTLLTVLLLWYLLLERPGWQPRDLSGCSPGQLRGCVGGLADVVLLPAGGTTTPPVAPASTSDPAHMPTASATAAAIAPVASAPLRQPSASATGPAAAAP